jgi:hypothetical protein
MSTLLMTVIIACIVCFLGLILFGISWILTGRSRLQPGACGRDPTKKREDSECGTKSACQLCERPEKGSHDNTISEPHD